MNKISVLPSKGNAPNAIGSGRNSRHLPRIAGVLSRTYPWYVRLLFLAQRRKYGQELEPTRLWGRIPWAFVLFTMLYRWLDRKRSPIEPGLRSLVQIRISQINWCDFCVDLNSAIALERLVSHTKLASLDCYETSPDYTERERATLAYADAMTDSRKSVDDELFARLRRSYGDDDIVELTALIAFQNLSSKFNSALGVPAKGFCTPPAP